MRASLCIFVLGCLLLGGCHGKQIRHLASDASLIKQGKTTVQEMRKYLGEPDGQRELAPGVSEYIYYEDRPGMFGTTPLLGSMTGPSGYETILVTIKNEIVISCEFRTFNESDRKWKEDFSWDQLK
jgi:hypothetical protein